MTAWGFYSTRRLHVDMHMDMICIYHGLGLRFTVLDLTCMCVYVYIYICVYIYISIIYTWYSPFKSPAWAVAQAAVLHHQLS